MIIIIIIIIIIVIIIIIPTIFVIISETTSYNIYKHNTFYNTQVHVYVSHTTKYESLGITL